MRSHGLSARFNLRRRAQRRPANGTAEVSRGTALSAQRVPNDHPVHHLQRDPAQHLPSVRSHTSSSLAAQPGDTFPLTAPRGSTPAAASLFRNAGVPHLASTLHVEPRDERRAEQSSRPMDETLFKKHREQRWGQEIERVPQGRREEVLEGRREGDQQGIQEVRQYHERLPGQVTDRQPESRETSVDLFYAAQPAVRENGTGGNQGRLEAQRLAQTAIRENGTGGNEGELESQRQGPASKSGSTGATAPNLINVTGTSWRAISADSGPQGLQRSADAAARAADGASLQPVMGPQPGSASVALPKALAEPSAGRTIREDPADLPIPSFTGAAMPAANAASTPHSHPAGTFHGPAFTPQSPASTPHSPAGSTSNSGISSVSPHSGNARVPHSDPLPSVPLFTPSVTAHTIQSHSSDLSNRPLVPQPGTMPPILPPKPSTTPYDVALYNPHLPRPRDTSQSANPAALRPASSPNTEPWSAAAAPGSRRGPPTIPFDLSFASSSRCIMHKFKSLYMSVFGVYQPVAVDGVIAIPILTVQSDFAMLLLGRGIRCAFVSRAGTVVGTANATSGPHVNGHNVAISFAHHFCPLGTGVDFSDLDAVALVHTGFICMPVRVPTDTLQVLVHVRAGQPHTSWPLRYHGSSPNASLLSVCVTPITVRLCNHCLSLRYCASLLRVPLCVWKFASVRRIGSGASDREMPGPVSPCEGLGCDLGEGALRFSLWQGKPPFESDQQSLAFQLSSCLFLGAAANLIAGCGCVCVVCGLPVACWIPPS